MKVLKVFNTKIKTKVKKMELNLKVATIDDAHQAVRVLSSYIGSFGKEVEKVEVVKEEKPKVEKTVKVQVTVEDDSNEVEETKPTPKKEKVTVEDDEVEETKPTPKKEKTAQKVSVSTVSLTSKAKECIAKVGRDAVVKTISKYGERISAVDESDYEALDAELQSLLDEEV